MSFRIGGAFALVLVALTSSACVIRGSTSSTPVGSAQVESATIDKDIETAPSARYDGRVVYYYNGRWMYRDGSTWKYYVSEPPELYRYRTETLSLPSKQAPPAPRYERRPDQRPGEPTPVPVPAPTVPR